VRRNEIGLITESASGLTGKELYISQE